MPPSFAPDGPAPRPDTRGARPVGDNATRPMPARRPAPEARPAGPERRSTRPPQGASPDGGARPAPSATPPPAYPPRPQGGAAAGATGAPRSVHPAQHEPFAGGGPQPQHPVPTPAPARRKPRRRGRRLLAVVVVLLVLALAWPIGLLVWANGQINHVTALSGAADTPGRTVLLAGSDSRADGAAWDSTEGERADTIMVLHKPSSGPAALISLPRGTYTEIPGHGMNKLNASYSLGGPELLVASVESLTGLTVDHYVEVGMGGVQDVVNAVGGVELCLDYDVDDWRSRLQWEAGCHHVDGETALSFVRMRYADREGDLGRTARQRQLVGAIISEVATPATILDPRGHVDLIDAGLSSVVVDDDTNIIDLALVAWAFRAATGSEGLVGPPPVADLNYRPGSVGSTVLLDEQRAPTFFTRLRDGELTESDFE